jgi:hypothetical protein
MQKRAESLGGRRTIANRKLGTSVTASIRRTAGKETLIFKSRRGLLRME